MGDNGNTIKVVLFALNVLLAISGFTLFGLGINYHIKVGYYTESIPENYSDIEIVPTLTAILGAVIVVIAAFGTFAVFKENTCLTALYSAILLKLCLIQACLGVVALLEVKDTKDLKQEVFHQLYDIFGSYSTNKENRDITNLMQIRLSCCGVTGRDYWPGSIPDSCCKGGVCTISNSFKTACGDALYDVLYSSNRVIGITTICLSFIELFGAAVAVYLANTWRNQRRRMMAGS